jgi:hypothetical protein
VLTNPPSSDARPIGAVEPRRPTCLSVAWAVGTAGILAVGGCGGNAVHTQSAPPAAQATIAAPTRSTQPSVQTPRQTTGAAAAVGQVRRYETVIDELSTHPRAPLDALRSVSTSPDLAEEVGSINRFRDAHDRIVGHSRVTSIRIDSVRLRSRRDGHLRLPTVRVSICLDVARVRAYDNEGHSIVPRSRKPYFLTHLTVINRDYPRASGWLVARVTDREVGRCVL